MPSCTLSFPPHAIVLSCSFHSTLYLYSSLQPLILRAQSCLLRGGICLLSSSRKGNVAMLLVLGSEWHRRYPPNFPSSLPKG